MTDLSLFSKVDQKFDYTCLSRYLDKPNRVTLNPTAVAYWDACRPYNYNWLLIWCVSYVLTNEFVVSSLTEPGSYNFLSVPGGRYRSWREGISAGLDHIKALNPDKTVSGLDKVYSPGTGDKVLAVYEDVLKYWQNQGSRQPPIEVNPAPEPIPVPEPVKEEPKPEPVKDPNARASWQVWLAGVLGTVGSVWWLAKLFLPGSVDQIGDVVIALLKKLAGM